MFYVICINVHLYFEPSDYTTPLFIFVLIVGDITDEEKEETLKDIIYRIVQDTLRKKLVESMVETENTRPDMSMESSIIEVGGSDAEEESNADEEGL